MLQARGLTKRYGGLLALDRVNFDLRPGEIVGYLGPNGSGKSTTVNLVVGLLEPSAGDISLSGIRLSDDAIAYKRQIGYVPEEPSLYAHLTASDYLTMIFLAVPAMRLALWIPLDLRSNWVFRMTEDEAGRAEVAAANVRAVWALAVALPLALIGPLQWWVLGPSALGVLIVEMSIGWLLVEWTMADWQRIPFTCAYLPGKGFVPHMFVKGFASFVFVSMASVLVLRLSLARPLAAVICAVVFSGTAAILAVLRVRHARQGSLIFKDELPTDVNPLRLTAD